MNKYTGIAGDGSKVHLENGVLNWERSQINKSDIDQMGYFGNIWVRSHTFKKVGDTNGGGHKHNFDHVTLLAVGSVLCEVEGYPPKQFDAPTFIVIDKEKEHKFTALTDGVVYYCVFAVRDLDGNVENLVDENNSPVPFFAEVKHLTVEQLEVLKQEI